jgi:hypothetical protein
MNFMKNIFGGNIDEAAHNKFVRYSKGTFEKEPFKINVKGSAIQIKAGFEYLDVLIGTVAELNTGNIDAKGMIVTAKDILKELKEMGVEPKKVTGKKYTIEESFDADRFRKFFAKFRNAALLLNLNSEDFSLSCGKSIPKPGKPVEDFCKAKFPKGDLDKLKKEFLFDAPGDFKNAVIKHIYIINDFEIPKDAKTPEEMRLKARRVGKLLREVDLDGKISRKEITLRV